MSALPCPATRTVHSLHNHLFVARFCSVVLKCSLAYCPDLPRLKLSDHYINPGWPNFCREQRELRAYLPVFHYPINHYFFVNIKNLILLELEILKTNSRECILGAAMPCHVLPYSALQFFYDSLQNLAIPCSTFKYFEILPNTLQCLATIFCIIAPACAARLDRAVQASAAHQKTPHCPFS